MLKNIVFSRTGSKFVTDFRGALIYGLRLYPSNLINVIVAKGKSSATFLDNFFKNNRVISDIYLPYFLFHHVPFC